MIRVVVVKGRGLCWMIFPFVLSVNWLTDSCRSFTLCYVVKDKINLSFCVSIFVIVYDILFNWMYIYGKNNCRLFFILIFGSLVVVAVGSPKVLLHQNGGPPVGPFRPLQLSPLTMIADRPSTVATKLRRKFRVRSRVVVSYWTGRVLRSWRLRFLGLNRTMYPFPNSFLVDKLYRLRLPFPTLQINTCVKSSFTICPLRLIVPWSFRSFDPFSSFNVLIPSTTPVSNLLPKLHLYVSPLHEWIGPRLPLFGHKENLGSLTLWPPSWAPVRMEVSLVSSPPPHQSLHSPSSPPIVTGSGPSSPPLILRPVSLWHDRPFEGRLPIVHVGTNGP